MYILRWPSCQSSPDEGDGQRTGIESDLAISLPVPDCAVFIHQFIYTELAISEHRGGNLQEIGEFLICFLDLTRPSPDTRWCMNCCSSAYILVTRSETRRGEQKKVRSKREHTGKSTIILQHPPLHSFFHKYQIHIRQSLGNLPKLRSESIQSS